ncbi:transporter substrate-binding domain-containing protein [Microbulbifer halophilus]|uniref:Transporter substrate-binding domain-containing protein n=1 Tax=Microbulbifer halophilus TaxID=453963 RepID=A0ABW5EAA4_9GAMM|nr:transporter substrate-binding domain-containing protein [Microbulbifer halophilus]MCW8125133.1 transporter substrate-binding domain-containing protein [Microbulbifer halophilus]
MHSAKSYFLTLTLSVFLCSLWSCGRDSDPEQIDTGDTKEQQLRATGKKNLRREAEWPGETTGEYPIDAYKNYTETGDLDAIQKRGKLRILVDIANTDSLHRSATLQDIEIELARRMARYMELEPVILYTDNFEQLIPLLRQGKGDIIANNLVITKERRKLVDYSIPTAAIHELLLSNEETPDVKKGDSLDGKTLAVTEGTTFETRARRFAKAHPGLELQVLDRNYVELAVDVSLGKYDFTIIDDQIFDLVEQFRDNLKENIVFPEEDQLAWGFRKNSPKLAAAVNEAVRQIKLTRSTDRFVGDLDAIRERGVLRAVTRNHPGTYYMWKGRVLGYEYELLKKFAERLDVRLEIIVTPKHEGLFTYLRDGKADLTASLLSKTRRREEAGMAFGPEYMRERVSVVGRSDEKMDSLKGLEGRTLHVLRSSSQYDVLMEIRDKVPGLKMELVPEELTIPQILDHVADGRYDLTIADDLTVRLEHQWRDDVTNLLDLHREDNVYAWSVRKSNPELLKAVNEFFTETAITELRNTLFHKYFAAPGRTRDEIRKLSEKGEISPFDDIVKKYAEQYDLDWRLVVAQMFQESTFDPEAKSWVGARGLMQVMPDTGEQVGVDDLFDPENSVRAGVKYLEWLHQKFDDKGISPENKVWFTLAAYNAGLGHVYDAQDLAEEKGWDRRVWFDNVEKAMLLLSERRYYKNARYGYARGREPYNYVRKIEARFRTYTALLEAYQRKQTSTNPTCNAIPTWLAAGWPECGRGLVANGW